MMDSTLINTFTCDSYLKQDSIFFLTYAFWILFKENKYYTTSFMWKHGMKDNSKVVNNYNFFY